MTRTPLILNLVAAAALAGCSKGHTIIAGPDIDNSDNAVNTANVQLPPAIVSSKSYRCTDGSVIYVDWLSDNKSANFRSDKTGMPTQLTATDVGKPMTGEGGYSLTGTPDASSIKLERPGKASQSCSA